MGICWSTNLPEEEEVSADHLYNSPNGKPPRKVIEFGREEIKLEELLASLRTGLVFAPTEFSVLPGGLNTTAKITFVVGNSELQRKQEASYLKEESLQEQKQSDEEGDATLYEHSEENEQPKTPFVLKVSLKGHGWAKSLVLTLNLQAVVGPFAGRAVQFHWRNEALEVFGSEKGELEVRSLPLSFESEIEFCKLCLQLIYQRQFNQQLDDENVNYCSDNDTMPSLKYRAYKVAVANLDAMSGQLHDIPPKLHHIFFGSQEPVDISITLWPKAHNTNPVFSMKVKSGILFGELVYLVKEHLRSKNGAILKLYSNYRPVHTSEVVSKHFKSLDCFMIAPDKTSLSLSIDDDESAPSITDAQLVVSLVGREFEEVEVDFEMLMKEFDELIRSKFRLKQDSFLVILAEDDFAPQYIADDNWKCTYPFYVPDNSFGAGLRHSFRRLSTRKRGGNERPRTPGQASDPNASTFVPLMAEVLELLSSDNRRFPRNAGRCGLSIEELYSSMPLYQMSIEQCGIHPYSVMQVFEVTGPAIPITVRMVSDYDDSITQPGSHAPRIRLANIMDINPEWSISTFLHYIDAVISLSSSYRQKRLWLRDNCVSEKDDLSGLTLGDLLDSWKPLWWAEKGCNRKQLTTKDIDPSEYLVVERF